MGDNGEIQDNKKIMKAHLVARVFVDDLHNLKTDLLACCREVMHFVMLTSSVKKLLVETLDFTSQFLQFGIQKREVFLRLPPDVCPDSSVWKLTRCIYRLNDALRSWYKRVNFELTNLKGIVNAYDNALFLWHDATGILTGILAMHVDNFIFCGNDTF